MNSSSITTIVAVALATLLYLLREKIWASTKVAATPFGSRRKLEDGDTRDVAKKMANSGKNCMVFFGSQSGGAEDIAARLAKEGHSRFGLETMVGSLEDYDYDTLNDFPSSAVAIFVIATFGEGEPPDSAQDFFNFITDENISFSNGSSSLSNLNFVSFGLGNSTYEHFNAASEIVNKSLDRLGGHRIGVAGRGDDGEKTTEEDFLDWKESMWAALSRKMGLKEREAFYEPVFAITERSDLSTADNKVYLGEPNQLALDGATKGPFNSHNPFVGPVVASRNLFKDKTRDCVHLEIDLVGSRLTYETGDHVSIFPVNSDVEVDRFLNVFGLFEKRDTVIDIKSLERTARVSFPVPTTYDTVARYNLEICAPVSRQLMQQLATFAPTAQASAELVRFGTDKDYFYQRITEPQLNLAQTLQLCGGHGVWSGIPFSILVEGLVSLQPRLYSISSSPLVSKDRLTITAKVESIIPSGNGNAFRGVASNYLLDVQQSHHKVRKSDTPTTAYAIHGPRHRYDGICIPLCIRSSTFRLPSNAAVPVIMVGPGTGVAPFRAFVQERAAQLKAGQVVGATILFYGCREKSKDLIYEEDWKEFQKVLGDKFKMVTAISRGVGGKKVYVQDEIRENTQEINDLLLKGAHFYVCGGVAMAKDVNTLLERIISDRRAVSAGQGVAVVKKMRASKQYQEDAWS
ncbi:NADPH--cytochrome P450 reductase [Lachnellula occidentalis]|uniref:NADPH--cytochrome P450 reductase n=1 Tax=Lachnellula occidentalis TaxID=215460 RepID=A0A8H8S3T8_9HELO|nr:NADPH--cytochrome P450 reductase [Lachnellula occidentalis]